MSELGVLTFSIGIVLGIAVGLVPVPLPGGLTLQLGLAGGPVVVAMVLGALGRTGPLVWGIPYRVNLTLRPLGLTLSFAGVGRRSGYAAWDALRDPSTLTLLAVGGAASAASVLLAGRYLFRVPESLLGGMIAGVHTQPAALGFAVERAEDESPNVGYAAVFPFATIVTIVVAQLIVGARG